METADDLGFLPCKVVKTGKHLHVAVNNEMTIVLSDLGRQKVGATDRHAPYLLIIEDVATIRSNRA
jgi:hypothetical protein